jgi:hypothetical protein
MNMQLLSVEDTNELMCMAKMLQSMQILRVHNFTYYLCNSLKKTTMVGLSVGGGRLEVTSSMKINSFGAQQTPLKMFPEISSLVMVNQTT